MFVSLSVCGIIPKKLISMFLKVFMRIGPDEKEVIIVWKELDHYFFDKKNPNFEQSHSL